MSAFISTPYVPSESFDLALFASTRSNARSALASTYGNCYIARANCTATGIRYYHVSLGAPETIKFSLWDSAGTRLTFETLAISATGLYEVTFASPQALTEGALYKATVFNTTNNVVVTVTPNSLDNLAYNTQLLASANLQRTTGVNSATSGDVNPTNAFGLYGVHLVTV